MTRSGTTTLDPVNSTQRPGWHDLIAGVSVALVLIPQALAYAEIAQLPASFGLIAAALPPVAAAFFASSRYLQTGPVAITSLLVAGALGSLAIPFSSEYVKLAALLALVVGVVRIALGMLRAGAIAYLMSQPVLAGFTGAAGIIIAVSQLDTALGVVTPREGIFGQAWWAITNPSAWDVPSVVISIITIVAIVAGRRVHRLFPGVLVAVAVALIWSIVTGYSGPVVGSAGDAAIRLSLSLPWSALPSLIIPGAVIAIVGFAEPAAIARVFAAQDRESWDPDREFISQGVANLAAGISGTFPVGGSFSRSSIGRLSGAQSRWAGGVTGLVVIGFLPFTSVLEPLPRAVLGAIVISAVAKLIRVRPLFQIYRVSRPQGVVAIGTFAATLLLNQRVEQAVLVGVGLGIGVHLWRELGVEVRSSYHDRILTLSPTGVLFFGSAPPLDQAFLDELANHPETNLLILDLSELGRIDYTGALALRSLARKALGADIEVELANVPLHSERTLLRVWHSISYLDGDP